MYKYRLLNNFYRSRLLFYLGLKMPNEKLNSRIAEFYANRNILITGGTGFLGRLLIEKLLRSCPDLAKIYLIIRQKKGEDCQQRLVTLFEDKVFDLLRNEQPHFIDKICAINGDVSYEGLGLGATARELLIENVDIVFHSAADLRMFEALKAAVNMNVRGTRELLSLCEEMKHLKCVIHLSTAYSFCPRKHIHEEFYPPPYTPHTIIDFVNEADDELMNKITIPMLKNNLLQWPNIYSFTKAIGEDLVREKQNVLPIGLFRPSIVMYTVKEPLIAYCDSPHGPMGMAALGLAGVCHVVNSKDDLEMNVVPADYCINSLIATAEHVAKDWAIQRHTRDVIFNYVSKVGQSLIQKDYLYRGVLAYNCKYPLAKAIYAATTVSSSCKYWCRILEICFHYIPGCFIDAITMLQGRKPQLLSLYKKTGKFQNVMEYFQTNEWQMYNDNVCKVWDNLNDVDKQIFPFSLDNFDWLAYTDTFQLGIKRDIAKDKMDEDSLRRDRARYEKLKIVHRFVVYGFYIIIALFIMYLYKYFSQLY